MLDRTPLGRIAALCPVVACLLFAGAALCQGQTNVLTQHNDPQRTGANLAETMLSPASVASPDFVQLGSYPVRGQVFAQPLLVSGVDVVGRGKRNLVLVATAKNLVYAFDADRMGEQAELWAFDAGSGITANAALVYSPKKPDISPEIGILGTPVIDLAHLTIYFVAMTQPVAGRAEFFHTLHAVDLRNGQSRGSIRITGNMEGGGIFNSGRENQRAALAMMGDQVFISWAGFGDIAPYDGLVMTYGAVDAPGGLKKHNQFQVAHVSELGLLPRHKSGGIWHSGGGPAIDERNQFMYVVTGNGENSESNAGRDFDSSDVKLDGTLRVIDYFTPSFQGFLNDNDLDLSVAGPMIPWEWRDSRGNIVRRMLHGSKQGILYNLNRDNMGHFHAHSNPIQQVSVFDEPNPGDQKDKNHIHSTPTLWQTGAERRVYVASDWGLGIRAFRLRDDGQLETTPFLSARDDRNRYAFNQLSLSANGAANGVLWTIGCVGCVADSPPETKAAGKQSVLLAYDASRLGAPIFSSSQLGVFARFGTVTVANGRVYVPTFSGNVAVFGLLPSAPPPVDNAARAERRNLLQSNWGRQGNFELLVPEGNAVRHFFRNNDDPQFGWHLLGDRTLAYPCRPQQLCATPRSATVIQSNFKGDGVHGNFEAIVRVAPPIATQPDHLDFWFLDSKTSKWNGPFPLIADGKPVDGVTGDPVLIQSNWGRQGNFELLVPQGHAVRHYFRNNDDPQFGWHLLGDRMLGYPCRPQQLCATPRSVTFLQSNFKGDGVHGNFEAIVRVAPPIATEPDHLDFWFLDSKTSKWNGPFPLLADGKPVDGVTGDPVLIQSNWGRQGNFELLVPEGHAVRHYFRNNDDPQFGWHLLADRMLGYLCRPQQLCTSPRSVTFIQSNFKADGVHGDFEAIVRVAPPIATEPDHLDFWFLDSRTSKWNGPFPLLADGKPVNGVTGN